jgi:hypothetical protein
MLHLVALVRTDISEERLFSQEPLGVTSQEAAFFMFPDVCRIRESSQFI